MSTKLSKNHVTFYYFYENGMNSTHRSIPSPLIIFVIYYNFMGTKKKEKKILLHKHDFTRPSHFIYPFTFL